ncbi:MAG: Glu-tRNA(Gln) amidotransferase subunit GatE [archaeon]
MEIDYRETGLKVGLEVHQQLDTGKLFCRCPSILRDDSPDTVLNRRLRPVASELGKYDPAALEAFRKGLSYKYEFFDDSNCLVEADEEPPMEMDSEALGIVLQIALMSESSILNELHVMRKQVIDGSNTSGFQRTAMIALGGKLKLKKKEIGVQTIVLEEDAARPMSKSEKEIVYRLDRMGIPLIELATEPEIFSPEEAREAALAIGELFRRTGKVKRGLGSIRQDVNISIAKGARIEAKGIQELELIGEYVKGEVERQLNLLEVKRELTEERNLKEEELSSKAIELNELLKDSTSKLIKGNLSKGNKVLGVKLKSFNGLLGKELQPNRRLGTEFADYVKARSGLKGIIHSDELPAYGITEKEKKEISERLECGEGDAFAFVLGEREKAEKAISVVIERAIYCLKGVPEETRNAIGEGNTEYSRPLPGAARMYPETDIRLIRVDEKELEEMKKNLPLSIEQRYLLYLNNYKLNSQLAEKMKLSNYAPFYEKLVGKGLDATNSAVLLLEGLTQLKRERIAVEKISNEMIEEVLLALKEEKITKEVMLKVLSEWIKKPSKKLKEVIDSLELEKISEKELKKLIKEVIEKNEALFKTPNVNIQSALMGDVMIQVKGRASGKLVNKILSEELEKMEK